MEPLYPNGDIQFYNLTITDGGGVQEQIGGVSGLSFTVTLLPFTTYSVVVRAVHVVDGELSMPVTFTSMEDGKCFM